MKEKTETCWLELNRSGGYWFDLSSKWLDFNKKTCKEESVGLIPTYVCTPQGILMQVGLIDT